MSIEVFTRKPISRQAARAIWRAPWWAHLNEAPKQARKAIPVHELELCADLFRPPPELNSIDRRGLHVRFFNGGERGVITGFHRRQKTGGKNEYYWWVMREDGTITTLCWRLGKKGCRYELIRFDDQDGKSSDAKENPLRSHRPE